MAPQCLGIQERNQRVPNDKHSPCNIDDEEVMLPFDKRSRRVTIKHDPNMPVPVLTVKSGVKNYHSFSTDFCSIEQDKGEFQCMPENFIESFEIEEEFEGFCPRSIDANRRLSAHTYAAELTK